MIIKKYTSSLLELIRYGGKDKTLELEARFKSSKLNPITSEIFFNVMKRLKGMGNTKFVSETTELDIGLIDDYEGFRVTINSDEHITQYCKTNDIKQINPKMVSFMNKTPIRHIDLNEYNLRFNLKREIELPKNDKDIGNIIGQWNNLNKGFRYKKRVSFISSDGLYRFDLTILRSSTKKMVKKKNTFTKKKNIKPFMIKYVVKPDYVVDVKSWLEKQDDNANIEMRGKIIEEYQYFKSLQKSNVLKNDMEYEIEIEYLGNKSVISKSNKDNDKQILVQFIRHIITVQQAIQKSYYIISNTERNILIDQYKSLIGDYKFNGPMNVSITRRHIVEKNYNEYNNSISIRKGYSVTDKADGERNLLIILDDGSMFMMNRKNHIRKLEAKCPNLKMSIFDVEYLMKDKNNNNINMLLLFDVYFVNGEDMRQRILYRNNDEIRKNIEQQSRYEIMMEKMEEFNTNIQKSDSNTLEVLLKNFYFGDNDIIDEESISKINSLKSYMSNLDKDSAEYRHIQESISVLKADTLIFKQASKVYNKEYPYHIDGLVFTPKNLAVGEEPERDKKDMFNGRWYRCLKWKPPEENSIDFMCIFKKDSTNKYETKYLTKDGKVISCRIVMLHVGYNPRVHTKHNSFRVLNENIMFDDGYNPTIFAPVEPYMNNIHICYLPIVNGNCYADDKNIITNNSIVEFTYNSGKDIGFCWNPLRIRDTLKPNDFITANNVWNSIFNPVTLDMISTGEVYDTSEVYFDNFQKRSNKKSKPMNDFHSFIKKKIIKDNLLNKKTILDIGVGKAGDLNHWLDAGCSMVVGIDSVKDNLDNSNNGACNRMLSKYSSLVENKSKSSRNNSTAPNSAAMKQLLENSLMVWADCSKNIIDGSAAKDDLSKHYLNLLYGGIHESETSNIKLKKFYNKGNDRFDLVVSNFAIHYFFENIDSLEAVLNNVSSSLVDGGRFVCSTINGSKLFNNLKHNNVYHSVDLSWKIEKKYTQTEFPDSIKSLGYKVGVYVDSIGQTLDEYLVNPEFFTELCSEHGLKLIETRQFEEVFNTESANKTIYGEMLNMDDTYKPYSFLNMYMVFEKHSEL